MKGAETRRGLLAAAAGGALAAPALAQVARFPERPIEIAVGFIAGGGTDLDARSYARALEQRLGGTVVVNNRPGAGGELALGAVARARPDGHTLGTTNMPSFATIPIERQAQFKLDDFAPIANLVTDPSAITAHAEGPFGSLAEVIERARAAPDRITCASPGVGTDDHLQLVLLQEAAGVRLNHVAFQGDGLHGRGLRGYAVAFNLLLRPSLMLFGLFLSYFCFAAISRLIFMTFSVASGFALSRGWLVSNLLGVVVMLAMFVLAHTVAVIACFRMISLLPQHVPTWLGLDAADRLDTHSLAQDAGLIGLATTLQEIRTGAASGVSRLPAGGAGQDAGQRALGYTAAEAEAPPAAGGGMDRTVAAATEATPPARREV